jgi:hypothetical protein
MHWVIFLAMVDLSETYRSIPIHPYCFTLTGLQWTFTGDLELTLLFDAWLPFGSSLSCKVIQSVSDAVARIFKGRGYFAISYIDDFLIVANMESLCKQDLDCLTSLIQDLGLVVTWDKVSQPATVMTFFSFCR